MTATTVKEKPIIFTGHSPPAIIDGRKWMTRRVVRWPKNLWFDADGYPFMGIGYSDCRPVEAADIKSNIKWPYGSPGDRMWVRETWTPDAPRDGTWADVSFYGCDGASLEMIPERFRKPEHCLYRSSWTGQGLRWRSPIFMPRWASRILLEITEVRVERLHAITEADALAEGFRPWTHRTMGTITARSQFAERWAQLNAKRGFSWESNPWVFVIAFRRIDAR